MDGVYFPIEKLVGFGNLATGPFSAIFSQKSRVQAMLVLMIWWSHVCIMSRGRTYKRSDKHTSIFGYYNIDFEHNHSNIAIN
jgi:hypothetical protein